MSKNDNQRLGIAVILMAVGLATFSAYLGVWWLIPIQVVCAAGAGYCCGVLSRL